MRAWKSRREMRSKLIGCTFFSIRTIVERVEDLSDIAIAPNNTTAEFSARVRDRACHRSIDRPILFVQFRNGRLPGRFRDERRPCIPNRRKIRGPNATEPPIGFGYRSRVAHVTRKSRRAFILSTGKKKQPGHSGVTGRSGSVEMTR